MHLELVELLRCPKPHTSSVLVAASDKLSSRYIMQGVLGCPECAAEYAIRGGVAFFDVEPPLSIGKPQGDQAAISDRALRVAAQLAMSEGRSVYALVGFDAHTILNIRALVPARLMIINPTNVDSLANAGDVLSPAPAGMVISAELSAFMPARFDGVAFAVAPTHAALDQAVDMLKGGGRLVAPAGCQIPNELRELVRDERDWVATRERVASAPVGITRR
jgi:uncharacterized protein YbaR (Trm112 family)